MSHNGLAAGGTKEMGGNQRNGVIMLHRNTSTPESGAPHKGVFNVSSLSTREGSDGSSNAQEEMVLRQV